MNKYERLFDEIVKQTESRLLQWKQVRRQANSELIFNPGLVFRQFATDFTRGDTKFKLLLVEKKPMIPSMTLRTKNTCPSCW